MWISTNYSDVLYISKALFELSLKMWFVTNYSNVIYIILKFFWAEFENVVYC